MILEMPRRHYAHLGVHCLGTKIQPQYSIENVVLIFLLVSLLSGLTEYGILLGLSRYWEQKNDDDQVQIYINSKNLKSTISHMAFKVDMITLMISLTYYVIFFVCYWLVLYV